MRQQQASSHGAVSAEFVHSVVLLQAVMRLFLLALHVFGLQPATRRAMARFAPHDLPTTVVEANFLEPLPLQHVRHAVRPHLARICFVGCIGLPQQTAGWPPQGIPFFLWPLVVGQRLAPYRTLRA